MAKQDTRLLPASEPSVNVSAGSLIFPAIRKQTTCAPGQTIEAIIDALYIDAQYFDYLTVFFEGNPVPRSMWKHVRPKAGTHVNVAIAPSGGGSAESLVPKDTLRLLSGLLVTVAGAAIPGALGLSGAYAALATAGISAAGLAAVNALIPPPKTPGQPESNALTGTRNRIRQGEPIPKIYGKVRTWPPLAMVPYTESYKNEQYLNLLFCVGYGPLLLSDFRIGNTPVSDYKGVKMEVLYGMGHDKKPTLVNHDVYEESLNAKLSYAEAWTHEVQRLRNGVPNMVPENHPNVIERVTADDVDAIGVEIAFPQGLYRQYDQGAGTWRVDVHVQYKPVGAGENAWIDMPVEIDNDGRDEIQTITETLLWEWLEEGASKLDELLDDVEAYELLTGNDLVVLESFLNFMRDAVNRMLDRLSVLDTTDDEGEPVGWREARRDHLEATLGELGTRLDDFLVGAQDQVDRAFQDIVDRFVARNEFLGAIIEVNSYLQQGYAPAELHQLPAAIAVWIVRQGLDFLFEIPAAGAQRVIDNDPSIVRRSVRWELTQKGKYVVRVRRASPDSGDDSPNRDEMYWSVLRSFRSDEPPIRAKQFFDPTDDDYATAPELAMIALRIKATDQLQGSVDTLSCIAEAILPWNDGATWQDPLKDVANGRIAGKNPAWAVADILAGGHNARALNHDEDLDVERFLEFADHCTFDLDADGKKIPMTGFEFNHVFDRAVSVIEAVQTAAGAGRASHTKRNGYDSIVIDKAQTVPKQTFNARNSKGFRVAKSFRATPQALKILYINPDADWQQDEWIVYADGFSPENPPSDDRVETIELTGVTDSPDTSSEYHTGQVHRLGRYYLAVGELRPETFQIQVDFEHIVCERGDLVAVSHPVTLWGLGAARIVTVNRDGNSDITSLKLDDLVYLDPDDKPFSVRVRTKSGVLHTMVVDDTGVEYTDTLTLTTPYDDGAELIEQVAEGDLASYGKTGFVDVDCIVTEIRPGRDLSAALTLVEYNAGIYTAEVEPIPPFTTKVTRPADPPIIQPPAPTVQSVVSDEAALRRMPDGSFESGVVLKLDQPHSDDPVIREAAREVSAVELQFLDVTPNRLVMGFRPETETNTSRFPTEANSTHERVEWERLPLFTRDLTGVRAAPVQDGKTYNLRVRFITRLGTPGLWTYVRGHTVVGKTSLPPDVRSAFIENRQSRVRWHYENAPLDLRGFLVRFASATVTEWSKATPAHEGVLSATVFDFPPLDGGQKAFFIKAVDTSGNESANAARVVVDLTARLPVNVVKTIDERALGWQGIIRNGSVDGGTGDVIADLSADPLFLGDPGELFLGDDGDDFLPTTYEELIYETEITVDGDDAPGELFLEYDIEGGDDIRIEYRLKTDSPLWPGVTGSLWPKDLSAAYWPASMIFQRWPGTIDAEAKTYKFRVVVPAGETRGRIKQFKIKIDVPDVEEILQGVQIDANSGDGERLSLAESYRAITAVVPALTYNATYSDAVKVEVVDMDAANGPLIKIRDASNNVVTGVANFIVRGY